MIGLSTLELAVQLCTMFPPEAHLENKQTNLLLVNYSAIDKFLLAQMAQTSSFSSELGS